MGARARRLWYCTFQSFRDQVPKCTTEKPDGAWMWSQEISRDHGRCLRVFCAGGGYADVVWPV